MHLNKSFEITFLLALFRQAPDVLERVVCDGLLEFQISASGKELRREGWVDATYEIGKRFPILNS